MTWVDDADNVLQSGLVAYGEMPEYTGETPTKEVTAQHTFTFKYWTPAVEPVTGEATYTATFGNTINTYMIEFVANNGEGTMAPVMHEWGDVFELPACEFTAPLGHVFRFWLVKGDFDVVNQI